MLRPDLWGELDARLVELLGTIKSDPPFGDVSAAARRIVDAYTMDKAYVVEEEEASFTQPHTKLLRHNWQEEWQALEYVDYLPFAHRDMAIYESLREVFHGLVRLVLDARSAFRQQEYVGQLAFALSDYLSLRRYPVGDGAVAGASDGGKHELEFVEGAFVLHGKTYNLRGKPLEVLRMAAQSRDGRCSAASMKTEIWDDDIVSDDTIRTTVAKTRAALRSAIEDQGQEVEDPFPNVDQGKVLAYKLDLP